MTKAIIRNLKAWVGDPERTKIPKQEGERLLADFKRISRPPRHIEVHQFHEYLSNTYRGRGGKKSGALTQGLSVLSDDLKTTPMSRTEYVAFIQKALIRGAKLLMQHSR